MVLGFKFSDIAGNITRFSCNIPFKSEFSFQFLAKISIKWLIDWINLTVIFSESKIQFQIF